MPNAPRQRRSPAELDRLAREAARLSFQEGWAAADVAAELQLPGRVREVAVLLKRSRGLVRVHVTEANHDPPPLNERLGRELELRMGLSCALVVRTREDAWADDRSHNGTRLHNELGRVAARQFLGIVRARDTIAVCAGRGVGYAIENVYSTPGLEHHPAYGGSGHVLSLAGGVFLPAWTERPGLQHLDNADFNAHKLSDALGRPSSLCCVRAYRPDEASRNLTIKTDASHLIDDAIDIAVYGAGVVDDDHYLQRITDTQADAIRDERRELRELAENPATRAFVIDHCEHFYVAAETPPEYRDHVTRLVGALNQKIVAIDPERIKAAAERMLVAGGADKRAALLQLSSNEWQGPTPTTLVTDDATAQALLDRLPSAGRS